MGISGVGSFPVQSAGSLIFFPVPRCRNLALNRIFPTFLSGRHVFCTWGVSGCPPMFVHPLYVCMPLYVHMPPRGIHPLYVPHTPLCICMFSEAFACCGGCKGLPYVLGHFPYTTPVWGYLPSVVPPHSVVGFPKHWYVSGISICHVGIFPFVRGLGCSPISGDSGGHTVLVMSICSFLYIFVVTFLLWLQLLLLQLWWYLLACHQSHQWLWLHPSQGFQ